MSAIASTLPADTPVFAMIARFPDVDSVVIAAEEVRDAGYTIWDVHSPFPIHGISKAMGLRPTILPWISLAHGFVGFIAGLLLVWWTNATTIPGLPAEVQGYQYLISGKPTFSLAANIPIIFETTVLFAAIGTLLGLFGLNKQPMLYSPLFKSRNFRDVTRDGFFLVVESEDPLFDRRATAELLQDLGATSVETVSD